MQVGQCSALIVLDDVVEIAKVSRVLIIGSARITGDMDAQTPPAAGVLGLGTVEDIEMTNCGVNSHHPAALACDALSERSCE
jgi:hypothetical protein